MAETKPTKRLAAGETANDEFKQGFGNWFWGSIAAATLVHFMIFAFFPSLRAEDVSFDTDVTLSINLPPEVEIPPPPQQIARPATPVISETMIDEDITIAPTTFEHVPVNDLPPPPTGASQGDIGAAPAFTPFTVAPVLINRAEVERALMVNYPPLLRDAGIGGQAMLWFFINEQGTVLNTDVKVSSGFDALDDAAREVAKLMKFSPAKNRDRIVKVWVAIPITFTAR